MPREENKTLYSIVFIGAGNLASSLAPALKRVGCTILQVYSRTKEAADLLVEQTAAEPITDFKHLSPAADVYIYALADEIYNTIPAFTCKADSVHLLTAGSVPLTALSATSHRGVLYPFQTFSKAKPVTDFASIPIMIEGEDTKALSVARSLADSISRKVYETTAETRLRLHLAGVFANNFSNCMYALAEEQLRIANLPFDILLPLIEETAAKVHTLSPRQAQTGPASRRDYEVMQRQLHLLETDEQRKIYSLISDNIIKSLS